jgi:P27 family predicted phage terminase small subunit
MGRRGPVGKPTPLRILHGDRPNRINHSEPMPRDLPTTIPPWLSPLAAAEWHRIADDLDAMGVTREIDSSALAAYCESYARWRTLTEVASKSPPLIANKHGQLVKNPVYSQIRDASADLRVWAREFGLTPSARSALHNDAGAVAAAERLLSG